MAPCCLDHWVIETQPLPALRNVATLTERDGARDTAIAGIHAALRDHLYGADVLDQMDFPAAAQVVRDALPTEKKIRSGDLGEIFATEYVIGRTDFAVPLKRLRYKDDREMAMRGTDVVGLRYVNGRPHVLKLEAKSREVLRQAVIGEACDSLVEHDCRPKPATLAFIARVLRREGRDGDAASFEDLQARQPRYDEIAHMVFVFSGNDPVPALSAHAGPRGPVQDRRFVGMKIPDHQTFIAFVFDSLDAADN
ncbi:MAG: Hachiman antiphage defense system protein HamA [Pirellulales bacterium]